VSRVLVLHERNVRQRAKIPKMISALIKEDRIFQIFRHGFLERRGEREDKTARGAQTSNKKQDKAEHNSVMSNVHKFEIEIHWVSTISKLSQRFRGTSEGLNEREW